MTDLDLTGRTALVSGAAQGLGEGMAQALAAAGARVVVADLQDDLGEKVADSLKGDGHGFVHLDVTDEAELGERRHAAASDFGGLDILVNNAGVEITSLITEVDPKDIRTMLEVNILGTALGLKWGLRTMRPDGLAGKGGSIINISSVAATIAFPGIPIYSATKSAVDRLTRVAAMEAGKLGYGVRVNCIYPGLVPTAMGAGPRRRHGGARPLRLARGSGRRGHRAHARPAGSARSPTWPTPWCSWPPTPRASSTESACRSTAEWGCEP